MMSRVRDSKAGAARAAARSGEAGPRGPTSDGEEDTRGRIPSSNSKSPARGFLIFYTIPTGGERPSK